MGNELIQGVKLTKLKQIIDERGAVMHFLKGSSVNFQGFGEVYFSKVNGGIVKGWKLHFKAYQNICVPIGKIKFILFDNRQDSETFGRINEFLLDESSNYYLLSFPPNLWYSFKSFDSDYSILANVSSEIHDPTESLQMPLDNDIIKFRW
jgi:dTDP-4-dehydrorhamnose 3,5-epimerase